MKIIIEIDVEESMIDMNDASGLTLEAFEEVMDALMGLTTDIKIRKG